jgi:hypothetical protein
MFSLWIDAHLAELPVKRKKIPECSFLARFTPCKAPNEEKQLKLPKSHSSIHLFIKQKITGNYTLLVVEPDYIPDSEVLAFNRVYTP